MNLWILQGVENTSSICRTINLSRRTPSHTVSHFMLKCCIIVVYKCGVTNKLYRYYLLLLFFCYGASPNFRPMVFLFCRGFKAFEFLLDEEVSPTTTSHPAGPGVSGCSALRSKPVRITWRYQHLGCYRQSFRDW
jgi:hypothetical protein